MRISYFQDFYEYLVYLIHVSEVINLCELNSGVSSNWVREKILKLQKYGYDRVFAYRNVIGSV